MTKAAHFSTSPKGFNQITYLKKEEKNNRFVFIEKSKKKNCEKTDLVFSH